MACTPGSCTAGAPAPARSTARVSQSSRRGANSMMHVTTTPLVVVVVVVVVIVVSDLCRFLFGFTSSYSLGMFFLDLGPRELSSSRTRRENGQGGQRDRGQEEAGGRRRRKAEGGGGGGGGGHPLMVWVGIP